MKKSLFFILCFILGGSFSAWPQKKAIGQQAAPVVVLGFDDAELSAYNVVAPLLKKYGFGATFYVCEFPLKTPGDSVYYMKWPQIKALNDMGFEIGNHTGHHQNLTKLAPDAARKEILFIEDKCKQYGIPKPISLAYPGNRNDSTSEALVKSMGYKYARTGGSIYYIPGKQSLLAIPSYTMGSSDKLKERTWAAIKELQPGQILAFTIHGVPDILHPDYSTTPELLEDFFKYMQNHHYRVIAMRDLEK